jgi:hypothetical protein
MALAGAVRADTLNSGRSRREEALIKRDGGNPATEGKTYTPHLNKKNHRWTPINTDENGIGIHHPAGDAVARSGWLLICVHLWFNSGSSEQTRPETGTLGRLYPTPFPCPVQEELEPPYVGSYQLSKPARGRWLVPQP